MLNAENGNGGGGGGVRRPGMMRRVTTMTMTVRSGVDDDGDGDDVNDNGAIMRMLNGAQGKRTAHGARNGKKTGRLETASRPRTACANGMLSASCMRCLMTVTVRVSRFR